MENLTWFRKAQGKYRIFGLLNIVLGALAFVCAGSFFDGLKNNNKISVLISFLAIFLIAEVILILRNKKYLNISFSFLLTIVQVLGGGIAFIVFILFFCVKYIMPVSDNMMKVSNGITRNTKVVFTKSNKSDIAERSWKNEKLNDGLANQYGYDTVQSAINDGVDVNGNKL